MGYKFQPWPNTSSSSRVSNPIDRRHGERRQVERRTERGDRRQTERREKIETGTQLTTLGYAFVRLV
jgi:hypothetical protein